MGVHLVSLVVRRHHVHLAPLKRIFKIPAPRAGISNGACVQTLRDSFATPLLEGGYGIRTVQDPLGTALAMMKLVG